MFYLHHTPWWLRQLFPRPLIWDGPIVHGNEVYLTFDDGPHPAATPFVLDQLAEYGMKATFFCIGKNVVKNPWLYRRILDEGHAVGNHTMHHVNGRHTAAARYADDISEASAHIDSQLFRPPYGQIRGRHLHAIRSRFPLMNVVMWSMLTGDFDTGVTGQQCFDALRRYTKPGSIIVFHDSAKAYERLKVALPLSLEWLRQKGWQSEALQPARQ